MPDGPHQEAAILTDEPEPTLDEPSPSPRVTVAEWFAQFRFAMAAGIRHELPWELLPTSQVEVLQLLVRNPGMRISEIAQNRRLAVNTVSTLVKELQRKDYVRRRPDPRDGRAQLIEPTAEGEDAVTGWVAVNERFLQKAFSALPPDSAAVLDESLPALMDLLQAAENSYGDPPADKT